MLLGPAQRGAHIAGVHALGDAGGQHARIAQVEPRGGGLEARGAGADQPTPQRTTERGPIAIGGRARGERPEARCQGQRSDCATRAREEGTT